MRAAPSGYRQKYCYTCLTKTYSKTSAVVSLYDSIENFTEVPTARSRFAKHSGVTALATRPVSTMHPLEAALQTLTIRPRIDADLDRCADILRRVHAASGYPVYGVDAPRTALCSGDILHVWVAERQCEIIGHAALYLDEGDLSVRSWKQTHPEDNVATLGKLFVDPHRQGGGAATALIETAVTCCRDEGLRIVLYALIKDQAAIRLYRRLGWSEFARKIYRYGDGAQMEAVCFAGPESRN
nr:putative n-acetyltransferase [Quercus suber]